MRKLLIIIFLFPFFCAAQRNLLSDGAIISVITCGPSQEELYTAFGHSAIRVHDPKYNFDAAYNYGVFDFDQPNFYLNFAKGYLYYKLGVFDYQNFQAHYIADNRYVHEQILDLTQQQKQTLFDFLQHNSLPENESYRYDYFYNNCATKIRDVIEAALGKNAVSFDGSYVKTDYTIRELTDLYLKQQPWGDLGIDICLGLPMDKVASPYEYMFLPDYVESAFDHAFIKNENGVRPIVKKKNSIYEVRDQDPVEGLPHPLYVFLFITLVSGVLSFRDFRRKKLSFWFDSILFGVCGAIGVLLFFLWFFTDHQAAARNLNILWAFPGHVVVAIAVHKNRSWLKNYFLATFILEAMLLITWPLLPQKLHYSLVPIVVAVGIRAYTQFQLRKLYTRSLQTSAVTE